MMNPELYSRINLFKITCWVSMIFILSCTKDNVIEQKISVVNNINASLLSSETDQIRKEYLELLTMQSSNKNKEPYRAAALPSVIDLTPYFPDVGDQDQDNIGSCISYACSYIKGFQENFERQLSGSNRLYTMSAINLFARVMLTSNSCIFKGSYVKDNLDQLVNQGISLEEDLPYNPNKCIDETDPRLYTYSFFNSRFKISGYRAISFQPNNYSKIKNELANNNPVLLTISVDSSFRYYRGDGSIYDYSYNPNKKIFNHGITCIGYDDNQKAYKLINSYGSNWGDEGYLWISEQALNSYILTAYALDDIIDPLSEPALVPVRQIGSIDTNFARVFFPSSNPSATYVCKGFDIKNNNPDYSPIYVYWDAGQGIWVTTKQDSQIGTRQYYKIFYTKNDRLSTDDPRLTQLYFMRSKTKKTITYLTTNASLPGYTIIENLGWVVK